MCLEVRKQCRCGKQNAQFHLRDNILGEEVILALYCPECSGQADFDPSTMLRDNGWIIEYDMDLARFMTTAKLMIPQDMVSPEYLFDSGYACWLEMYPGEKEDILAQRAEIMEIQKSDPGRYLREISAWNIARIEQLKAEGWRKAQAA